MFPLLHMASIPVVWCPAQLLLLLLLLLSLLQKSDWEYGPMQGPKPCIPYKDLGEQSFQLLHMQLTAADNNARDRVTSQSAHEILSLLTLMAQSGRGSSAGDSTDLSFMMYTPGFLMGTVWAIGWHRGPQDTASADAGSSAEVSFFQWQLGQRLAAFKAVDPDWHTDNEVNPLHDFGKKAELTAFVAGEAAEMPPMAVVHATTKSMNPAGCRSHCGVYHSSATNC